MQLRAQSASYAADAVVQRTTTTSYTADAWITGTGSGAFTADAAYAVHEETDKGTLAEGKLADFIVISDDIMRIAPEKIPHIEVLATVLGGEIVYDKKGFAANR